MAKNKKENITQNLSLKSIILNDYASFVSFIFPLVIFSMALFIEIFGFFPDLKRGRAPLQTDAIPFFIQFGIIAFIIGLIVIFLRYIKIKKLFEKGTESSGIITRCWKYKGSFRIYFKYKYKNLEFDNSILTSFNKKTKMFLPNKKINVLFMQDNYSKATIKEIFSKN